MIGIGFMAFGILFAVMGTMILIAALRQRAEMRNCREVSARIVDFEKIRRRNGGAIATWYTLYKPVYEYAELGDVKRYVSDVGSTDPVPVGTEATLYLSKSGKIYDKQYSALMLIVGAAFMAFGIFFAVLGFILKRTLFL